MGEITQEALNIMLQDGKTKDNLKQVLSGVLENVASRAISEQIKAKNGSGNPEGGRLHQACLRHGHPLHLPGRHDRHRRSASGT